MQRLRLARLGGGAVKFGGRIGINGYELSEYDVTATGTVSKSVAGTGAGCGVTKIDARASK